MFVLTAVIKLFGGDVVYAWCMKDITCYSGDAGWCKYSTPWGRWDDSITISAHMVPHSERHCSPPQQWNFAGFVWFSYIDL